MKKKFTTTEQRFKFIDTYTKFDVWLKSVGFRSATLKESSTPDDYHYSHYIDSMYGVERYINDTFKISLRFLRGKNEHRIVFIGQIGATSSGMSIIKARNEITKDMRTVLHKECARVDLMMEIFYKTKKKSTNKLT